MKHILERYFDKYLAPIIDKKIDQCIAKHKKKKQIKHFKKDVKEIKSDFDLLKKDWRMNESGRKEFLRNFDSKLQKIYTNLPEHQQLIDMIPEIISVYQNEIFPSGILNKKDTDYCMRAIERLQLISEGWDYCNPLT